MPILGVSALSALWLAAVEVPLTSVTVYSDRARVVRTARLTVSGTQTLVLAPIRGAVDPSSIRVEAQGAEVTRVDIRPATADRLPAAEVRALAAALEQVEHQLTQARAEREVYTAQLGTLERLLPDAAQEAAPPVSGKGGGLAPARLDATGWRAASDFVGQTTASLQAKLRELELREQGLQREQERRLEEARRVGDALSRQGVEVVPTLSGQGAVTLTLTYFTSGARWFPAYELRLEPESNRVEVALAGRVSQDTGEDWEDAALTLSTALPIAFSPVPRLETWKIGQRERFIPTPAPVADAWRPAPPPSPRPTAPDEELRAINHLLFLMGRPQRAVEVARESTGNGALTGTVRLGGSPLSHVAVTATAPNLAEDRVALSNDQGQFEISNLPAGVYALHFDRSGFQPFAHRGLFLRQGSTLRVDAALVSEASSDEIRVMGAPPTIDVGSSSTGVVVSERPRTLFDRSMPKPEPTPPPVDVPVGLSPPAAWRPPVLAPDLPVSLAGGQALTFPAQRRETVRSGKGERRVPLLTETWPVQVERLLYPALTPNAFLVAQLSSPSRQMLPGGDAQLFVGEDPSGQARLERVSPGEPFSLPLGIDPAVRPVRNVQLVTTEKGFIGKDDLSEYRVTLEVANPYPVPLVVRLHDQWPLSRDEHVEVKLVSTEPFAEQDPDKGTLQWRLTLPPAKKTVATFRYTVRHPKGWRLEQQQRP